MCYCFLYNLVNTFTLFFFSLFFYAHKGCSYTTLICASIFANALNLLLIAALLSLVVTESRHTKIGTYLLQARLIGGALAVFIKIILVGIR